MLPLATVGFFSAGLFFAAFAYTFYQLTLKKIPGILKYFSYAYFSLAAAFMLWAVASFIGSPSFLNLSVLIGDGLLLLSTLFLLSLYFADNKIKNIICFIWIILSVFFLWWRMSVYPPAPFMSDGILFFNTQQPIAIVLAGVMMLVWLPVNLKVAKMITDKIKSERFAFVYSSIYVMATIAAVLFIAAKTILTITLLFTAVIICFIMLIVSNVMIEKLAQNYGTDK